MVGGNDDGFYCCVLCWNCGRKIVVWFCGVVVLWWNIVVCVLL